MSSGTSGAGLAQTIDRWRYVWRYHRKEQLARRLWRRTLGSVADRLARLRVPAVVARTNLPVLGEPKRRPDSTDVQDLERGTVRLLGQVAELGPELNWRAPEHDPALSPLWHFHLHYHEFLLGLAGPKASNSARRCLEHYLVTWFKTYPSPRGESARAWHPYCISRRIAAWTRLLDYISPGRRERLVASMAQQAEHLSRRLERDLGGNHLWENARALAIAGTYFAGKRADRWRSKGIRLLTSCLKDQLLPSGEHFERSPGYQLDLGQGLLELADWLSPIEPAAADRFRRAGESMLRFLDALRHPDGGLPLFGDTSLDVAPAQLPTLEKRSGWTGDYFVYRRGPHHLVFDAGDSGADDLPAHAHADLLTFELSAHGERWFVDSGTHSYQGAARQWYRSSPAHNVVTIDGVELADCWSSFRMGRRGHAGHRRSGTMPAGTWAAAQHDAYAFLGIPAVVRLWFLADDGPWFSVHFAPGGRTNGRVVAEFVHCHPDVTLLPFQGGALLDRPMGRVAWEPATRGMVLGIDTGRYAPRLGSEMANAVLALRGMAEGELLSAWAISLDRRPVAPLVALERGVLCLSWNQDGDRRRVYFQQEAVCGSSM